MYLVTGENLGQSAVARTSPRPAQHTGCPGGCWKFQYDGCSVPHALATALRITNPHFQSKDNPAGAHDTAFSKSDRTGACDKHDECYQTCHAGSAGGRSACDRQIYDDMMATCNRSSSSAFDKDNCRRWAEIYHEAIKRGAEPAYRGRQNEVCKCPPCEKPTWSQYPPCPQLRRKDGGYINWTDYLIRTASPNDPLSRYKPLRGGEAFRAYIESCKHASQPIRIRDLPEWLRSPQTHRLSMRRPYRF